VEDPGAVVLAPLRLVIGIGLGVGPVPRRRHVPELLHQLGGARSELPRKRQE